MNGFGRFSRRVFAKRLALLGLFGAAGTAAAQDHAGHSGRESDHNVPNAGKGKPQPAPPAGHAQQHTGHAGHDMIPAHAWRDPKIRLSPPPPLTGKGTGRVHAPDLPTLGYELDHGVKVFHLIAQPVERFLLDGPPKPGTFWERWHSAKGAHAGHDLPKKVHCWGFNGVCPGPLVECVQGDTVRFVVKNELPEATSIHWHGLEIPNVMDGVGGLTQPPIRPGETFIYEFTITQSGTFMYHSSFNDKKQVGLGLSGMLVVQPKDEPNPPDREVGILLQEWHLKPGNENIVVTATDPNWFTFNGKSAPSTEILQARVGERIRLRIANLSNMHSHPIHLHGMTWRVVGTEGGPIPESAQWPGNTVDVPPGGSRDLEFTFHFPGWWHFHCHKLHHIVNAHADVPMGVMGMGGMTSVWEVRPADGSELPHGPGRYTVHAEGKAQKERESHDHAGHGAGHGHDGGHGGGHGR